MASSCRTISVFRTILLVTAILFTFGMAKNVSAQALSTTFELDSVGTPIEEVAKSGDDWDVVNSTGGGSTVHTGVITEPAGVTRFTQGAKDENDFNTWAWDNATVPDKNDITNGYAALYNTGLTNLLYAGMDRYANNGSSNNGLWFLINPITLNLDGTISGLHTPGDILVVSEFSNGGGAVKIRLFRWVVSGGNVTTHLDSIAVSTTTGFAVVNTGVEPAPWPYTPKFGTAGTFPSGSIYELGLDLGALLGQSPSFCFSQVLFETRSSFSTDAELKDFLLGSFPVAPSASVNSDTVCVGNSGELCATVVGGIPPLSYSWLGFPDSTGACIHPTAPGTYTVVVTSDGGNGCPDTASGVLVVNQAPACNITNDGPFCPTSSNQHCGPAGMASYLWTISGDGSIVGADNEQCVTVLAGNVCGSYTLNLTITDGNGCSNTCNKTINLVDTTAPELSGCPSDASFQCYSQVPAAATVTALDNCAGSVTVNFNESQSNPGSSCNNIITRTWTATDFCNNTATCTQIITVNDDTDPVLAGCPSDASFQCYADVPPPADVTASDNCDGPITPVFSENQSNPGSSCNNIITRTWTATDICGNSVSCSQIITVNDNTAPVLSGCPDDASFQCYADVPPPAVVTALDNCDGALNVDFNEVQSNPGSSCNNIITRTWSAVDRCGNPVSCQQIITVNDVTPPSISCAGPETIECPATPVFPPPVVSDLCDPEPIVTFVDVRNEGRCPQEYSITRTWTATDHCGNAASCSQTITVQDTQAPVLTDCPDPIVVCEGTPVCPTPPTASDECDPDVPVVCTRSDDAQAGLCDPYPIGTTTITCVALDDCGNRDDCSFTVTVNANPTCSINDGSGFGSPICAGSSTPIVDLFCGPVGMASYSWSVDCGTIDGSSTSPCVSWIPPAVGGNCTFTLTIVDGNGCTSTCTRSVSVPNPTPCVLVPPSTLPICGSSGNQYCGPAGFADYQWSFSSPGNDWIITGGQGQQCITYTAGISGPATLLLDATNSFGCHSSCDVPIDCQPGFEGCTPGFWKNHTGLWNQTSDPVVQCVKAAAEAQFGVAAYNDAINGLLNQLFRNIFGLSSSEMLEAGLNSNLTMLQAINLGGGGFQKLARHGVAGLLSSCQVNYTYESVQVLTLVHDAIVNLEAEPTATQLAAANNNFPEINCTGGAQSLAPQVAGDQLNVEDDDFATDPVAVEKAAGSALPTEFALRGSYPNPFNASTQINFALPQAGSVRLVIYNILGQSVRTLLDGEQPAGERSVLWNGTDNGGQALSSGIYFYKISFNGQVKVGRMNLLK